MIFVINISSFTYNAIELGDIVVVEPFNPFKPPCDGSYIFALHKHGEVYLFDKSDGSLKLYSPRKEEFIKASEVENLHVVCWIFKKLGRKDKGDPFNFDM